MVRDMRSSVEFYRRLGFELLRDGGDFVELTWEDHRLFLAEPSAVERSGPTMLCMTFTPFTLAVCAARSGLTTTTTNGDSSSTILCSLAHAAPTSASLFDESRAVSNAADASGLLQPQVLSGPCPWMASAKELGSMATKSMAGFRRAEQAGTFDGGVIP